VRWLHSRVCAAVLTAVGASLTLTPMPAVASEATCQDLYVHVSILLTSQTMYGRLCAPAGATKVEVLIPGGTYNSSYWDIGYTPETRSFRLAMNNTGVATLALDRLGTGHSSKPLSTLLTATAQADAVHQVIQALRPRFTKVIVGGHSIGSAMAMIEAGTFHDVDGALVTGMTHLMKLTTVLPVLANMYPSSLDPQLAYRNLDPGYLTTDPGARYSAFHAPGAYDHGAIDYDESTKDVFAATEAVDTTALTTVVIPASNSIRAPVMIAMGDDPNFCGSPLGSDCSTAQALYRSEAPFYPQAPNLTTYVLHGYGHAINYAPNAPDYFQAVAHWVGVI
jgi:pimeloyl-ACP methyl ester carboxylesterase